MNSLNPLQDHAQALEATAGPVAALDLAQDLDAPLVQFINGVSVLINQGEMDAYSDAILGSDAFLNQLS